jgi:hypothetical protein
MVGFKRKNNHKNKQPFNKLLPPKRSLWLLGLFFLHVEALFSQPVCCLLGQSMHDETTFLPVIFSLTHHGTASFSFCLK